MIYLYISIFLFSFVLTYLIKNHAIKNALLAEVTERSSHSTPTPHGGGIAVALSWFSGISYLFYVGQLNHTLYYALMIGVIISVVSYLDDLYELSPKIRLMTQAAVALASLVALGGFEHFNLFFIVIENQIVTNIFAFFMIIWFINLYNFLDGIDGYAGSEAIFLGLAGFFVFSGAHFLVLVASVAGFLLWNWHKAKIFMGDVGSTLLGFNVAIFTLYYANIESQNFWIWIILFALFWFDATLTLLRRYKNAERLSQAHKKHAYQRITQSGYSHSRVVIVSVVINLFLLFLIYSVSSLLVAFLIAVSVLYAITKFIDTKRDFI